MLCGGEWCSRMLSAWDIMTTTIVLDWSEEFEWMPRLLFRLIIIVVILPHNERCCCCCCCCNGDGDCEAVATCTFFSAFWLIRFGDDCRCCILKRNFQILRNWQIGCVSNGQRCLRFLFCSIRRLPVSEYCSFSFCMMDVVWVTRANEFGGVRCPFLRFGALE